MIKNSSIIRINLKNLVKNYDFFKKIKKNIIVAPTIKANAYGIGAERVLRQLVKKNCK